jgi:hypothetical protein
MNKLAQRGTTTIKAGANREVKADEQGSHEGQRYADKKISRTVSIAITQKGRLDWRGSSYQAKCIMSAWPD